MSETSYRIAVIPGDGTGPEVVAEGVKALNAVAEKENLSLSYTEFDLGGERYKRTGDILPDEVLSELGTYDAMYL
ncbi:MAG: isocitrate/isopropylmalate family dehydrogenase, partial [Desulfococcaceae bacterium]